MSAHLGCGHSGLAAPDGPWKDGARLIVSRKYLGHAAVAHSERDVRLICDKSPSILTDSQSDQSSLEAEGFPIALHWGY